MERLIQVLDDVDDLFAVLRHRLGWWPATRPTLRDAARRPAAIPVRAPSP